MIDRELVDASLLLLALATTPVYGYVLFRHPSFCQKKAFTLFLLFLALYPFLTMLGHIVAISTLAILNASHDVFVYDFRFYALILFGVVFMLLNAYSLNRIALLSRGNWQAGKQLRYAALLQLVLILPSVVLNPMGYMPSTASLLIMGSLYLAECRKQAPAATYISPQAT